MQKKYASEPPSPTELSQSGILELPRVGLAPDSGQFLADRLRSQHRDELDTRPLRPLTAEDVAAALD